MNFERRNQQIAIVRPLVEDLEVDHDLVLGLLQLHHLTEFRGLARLAFADHFRRRFEHAQELALEVSIAAIDPCPGLFHHLFYARHHLIDLVAQAIELQLPHWIGGLFHSRGDL